MNLFVLDEDPKLAAAGLDDKRLGSALMEACTMLSVALRDHGEAGPGQLCRPTHANHPVTLWVGQNQSTFAWTLRYAHAVAREYRRRYHKDHAAAERLPYIAGFVSCLPAGPMLPFQNSARHGGFGLDFTHLPVPESYREYLQERWKTDKRPPAYTNREWPKWAQRSDQ